jgi:hypothetical protein
LRSTEKPPVFWFFAQMCVNPRKLNVSGFALASPLSVFGCEAPELNQARFIRVQFQPELSQALLPFLKEALGIGSLLEPHDDIIRVPHDYDVASSAVLSPVLGPKVSWPPVLQSAPPVGSALSITVAAGNDDEEVTRPFASEIERLDAVPG